MPVKKTMIFLFTLCSLVLHGTLFAQRCPARALKKFKKKIELNGIIGLSGDSVIKKIQQSSYMVIGYSEYNNASNNRPVLYHLLSIGKKHCAAYRYFIQTGENKFKIDTITLSGSMADSLASNLNINKPWEIKHRDDADEDYCAHIPFEKFKGCSTQDALSKAVIMLTPAYQFTASYYAPDYYEYTCCPGNPERQRFLNVVSFINAAFMRSKPGQ